MGYLSELTGSGAAKRRAEAAADEQAASIKASSEQAAKATRESAAQAARSQEAAAARSAAEGAASDALAVPLENPDIQIGGPVDESVSKQARKRRQTFGVGASSGVNI